MLDDRNESVEYTDAERAVFAALPRDRAVVPGEDDRLVAALRSEGFFRRRRVAHAWIWQAAAAAALFAGGGWAGAKYTARHSLETMLTRRDLTLTDRVFLLQRAGSAYVQAANGYADATSHTDSTAVQVAQQVLIGAAQAVARRSMDGGMTTRLTAAMQGSAGY